MSFNASLNIKQTGHAMLHIDEFDEDHLIPFPDFKVRGLLSANLYPEIEGTYHLISSSGFLSEIQFSGRGPFSGKRNSMEARLYRTENEENRSLIYVVKEQWNSEFTIFAADESTIVETWRPEEHPPAPMQIPDLSEQDPWETRNSWNGVISHLHAGNLAAATEEKSKLEEAQRAMRKKECQTGKSFEPLFFRPNGPEPGVSVVREAGESYRLEFGGQESERGVGI